ncbi:MAG: HD domain-containing protein [Lachnospiraceae bacterium]|nr:HD domain-containing protein [Lachnospiraceae bacterium]
MKYLADLHDGDHINDVYLIKTKQSAVTKNGKPYDNLTIADKSASLNAKIWEPNSGGIEEYEELDYAFLTGDVSSYQGALQVSVKRLKVAHEGEFDPADYVPVSAKDVDSMFKQLMQFIEGVKNPYLNLVLKKFFVEDEAFIKKFKSNSAAKMIHHGFVGGLLEHTLSVTRLCDYYTKAYPALNHDLLITSAILHDIGKTRELSAFPMNDYTDEGQLMGHIVIGAEMIAFKIAEIDDFPVQLKSELIHCILAHHGEYEYGSPKKPALMEAMALNLADNTDAKMETMTELFNANVGKSGWLGYNRLMESNVRKTGEW